MYNQVLLAHVDNPHHMEAMKDADGVGQVGFPGEGPFMIFYVKLGENRRVERAGFETYGCPSAIGCGSWLAQWVEGKAEDDVAFLSAEDVMVALGGLPLGKEHCAPMAIQAFRHAMEECQELEKVSSK